MPAVTMRLLAVLVVLVLLQLLLVVAPAAPRLTKPRLVGLFGQEVTGPWKPAPKMGNASEVGIPMLAATTAADVAADKTLVPRQWKGGQRFEFMSALQAWWSEC